MKTQSADTSPAAERILVEAYRRMTPAERLQTVRSLHAALVILERAGIRARRGSVPEAEMRLRVASLWLGREAMVRWFGWDPDAAGY